MSLFRGKTGVALCLTALVVVLSLVLVYSDQGFRSLFRLKHEKMEIEQANQELAEENRRLMLKIDRIKKDPRYIEDEARKKLGLVRPDETIFRLQEEPETGEQPAESPKPQ